MSKDRTIVAASVIFALAAAGCGSSKGTDGGGAAASGPELKPLLLPDGGLEGYSQVTPPIQASDVVEWAALNADTPARLRALGFVEGVRADLKNAQGTPGLNVIERFGTPAAAQREVRSLPGAGRVVRFPVPGVPGAVGVEVWAPRGRDVVFAKGSTFYLVGSQLGPGASRAALISAARRQYAAAP